MLRSRGDVGMLGPEAGLVDGQRPAHQGLGLVQAVGGLKELGQVVEIDGDVGMLGPVAGLVDGQRPAHQGLGLAQAVGGLKELGQVVDDRRLIGLLGDQQPRLTECPLSFFPIG